MVVAGLTTGFDVACNGPDATDRLPGGVPGVGLASVALGPGGAGVLVLANGSVVAVSGSDASGYFTAQAWVPTGPPPSSRFTTSCVVDANGDGVVDVVLGAAPGNASALLAGSVGGAFGVLSGASGLGAALAAAVGTLGVSAVTAVTCPPGGLTLVATTPGDLLLVHLTSSGTAVANLNTSSISGGGGMAGVAVGDLDLDGDSLSALDAVVCSAAFNALHLVRGLCLPGATA